MQPVKQILGARVWWDGTARSKDDAPLPAQTATVVDTHIETARRWYNLLLLLDDGTLEIVGYFSCRVVNPEQGYR